MMDICDLRRKALLSQNRDDDKNGIDDKDAEPRKAGRPKKKQEVNE